MDEQAYWSARQAKAEAEVTHLAKVAPGSAAHLLALAELRHSQGITQKSRKLTGSRSSGRMTPPQRKGQGL